MKAITLSNGMVTLVDDEDYATLSVFRWSATKRGAGLYHVCRSEGGRQNQRTIYMHRAIMAPPEGMLVDHADRDGLNNQRSNLRIATRTQNQQNQRRSSATKSSSYRGVTFFRSRNKWCAQIRADRGYGVGVKHINLGYFDDEESAAHRYDEAAVLYFGEFASLNFKAPVYEY